MIKTFPIPALMLSAAVLCSLIGPLRAEGQERGRTEPASTQPAAVDVARWEPAIAAFEAHDQRNTPPRDAILFVGSSSIVNWPTARSFPHRIVLNRGFGGSQIAELNEFVDRIVTPYRPRAIVLYSGDNDAAAGKSAAQIAADFREFVRRVRERLGTTPIYCLSIKPSSARWALWPTMRAANELIRRECEAGAALHFVDVASPLLGADGLPRDDQYVADRLHLSPAAYETWTRMLDRALDETLPR